MSEGSRVRSRSRVILKDPRKRRSRSCNPPDSSDRNERVPGSTLVRVSDDDDEKRSYRKSGVFDLDDVSPAQPTPKLVRVRSRKSRCSISYSRSLDSLDLLNPDTEWTLQPCSSHHSLASDEELEKERLDHQDQESNLSQNEDDEPQSPAIPAPLEVTDEPQLQREDEPQPQGVAGELQPQGVAGEPQPQGVEDEIAGFNNQPLARCIEVQQTAGSIEIVATHTHVWKGNIKEDGTVWLSVHSKEVPFPRESSMLISETAMQKVCKIAPQTVFTWPYTI